MCCHGCQTVFFNKREGDDSHLPMVVVKYNEMQSSKVKYRGLIETAARFTTVGGEYWITYSVGLD